MGCQSISLSIQGQVTLLSAPSLTQWRDALICTKVAERAVDLLPTDGIIGLRIISNASRNPLMHRSWR